MLPECFLGSSREERRVALFQAFGGGATTPDTTPPELVSATVSEDGITLTLVFDEAIEAGADGFSAGFTINTDGDATVATYASGTGTTTLVYSLSATVLDVDTLTLDYTQPGDGVQDAAGNLLATLSGAAVTNNSSQSAGNLIDEDFEGAGTPVGWSVAGGTPSFDNTSGPLSGAQDLLLNADGDDVRSVSWAQSAETWITFEWQFASVGADAYFIFFSKNTDLSAPWVALQYFGGALRLQDNAGSSSATADPLPSGTKLYFRVHILAGSGADAVYDVEFNTSSSFSGSGNKFTSYSSGTITVGLQIAQLYRDTPFGDCHFDNFKVSNSGWPL